MQCPKCRGAMEEVRHLAAHADRCTRCHGLWFDMREHVLLAEYAEEVDIGDEDTGERHNRIDRIHCPVCEGERDLIRMVDPQQPHIWFESCKYCYGRFYDAGEFRDYAERDLADWIKSWKAPERD